MGRVRRCFQESGHDGIAALTGDISLGFLWDAQIGPLGSRLAPERTLADAPLWSPRLCEV